MNDPFDLLGIEPTFDLDMSAVEKRHRDLSRVLHPDRHVGSSPAERRMSLGRAVEVNEAFRVVREPIRRAEALLRRHGVFVEEGAEGKADPEFLMEMMELRESLSEAKATRDAARIQQLANGVRTRQEGVVLRLRDGFARAKEGNGDGRARAERLVPLLGELRYYRRFLDEVGAIEEMNAEEEAPR
jgi:molecular chaperone HscB